MTRSIGGSMIGMGATAQNTMSSSSMGDMGGMEHPTSTVSVPPLVDRRVLMQFCRAIQLYADRNGVHDDSAAALTRLRARLDNLSALAQLCRLTILGLPHAFPRLLDELTCVAVDFPDEPLSPDPQAIRKGHEDEPDQPVMCAAVFDLLAGAAFVSKDDPARLDRLIVGVMRAVEHAICYPVAFANEAAAYLGEGALGLSSTQVDGVIANATNRLLEGDLRCDPPLPAHMHMRLARLAHKWLVANPVTEMFRALTGPALDHLIASVQPDDAQVGDPVTLLLHPRCVVESMRSPAGVAGTEGSSYRSLLENTFVLFCPTQPAPIVGMSQNQVQVEVPVGARTGPIAIVRTPSLVDVQYLLKRYACEYPVEWGYSLFSSIPMWKWAYPTAFGSPIIEVTQSPQTLSVDAYLRSGPLGDGMRVNIGEPVFLRYRIDPPLSDTAVPVTATASLGDISHSNAPDTIIYTPRQAGEDTIFLSCGALSKVVRVTISYAPTRTEGQRAGGSNRMPAEASEYAQRAPSEASEYAQRAPSEASEYAQQAPSEAEEYPHLPSEAERTETDE